MPNGYTFRYRPALQAMEIGMIHLHKTGISLWRRLPPALRALLLSKFDIFCARVAEFLFWLSRWLQRLRRSTIYSTSNRIRTTTTLSRTQLRTMSAQIKDKVQDRDRYIDRKMRFLLLPFPLPLSHLRGLP